MSVRLNVLLVQSSRMSGLQSGINADLVFQLMGVPGIDLSIVNSLSAAEIAETDRLLLSSFENDLAVLDWRDADDSLAALAKLGVTGTRAPHRLDSKVPAAASGIRRIYVVDLRSGDSPGAVVDAMKDLLAQRRVVAVPLSIGGASKPKPKSPENQPITQPPAVATESASSQAAVATGVSPVTIVPSTLPPKPNAGTQRGEPSDRDLDALVDGLNAGDW